MSFAAAREAIVNSADAHRRRVAKASGGGMRELLSQSSAGFGAVGATGRQGNGQALQLYKAFRDVQYTAIRPIVTRFASQPIRVAVTPRRADRNASRLGKPLPLAKALGSAFSRQAFGSFIKSLQAGGLVEHQGGTFVRRQKALRRRMPTQVKSSLPSTAIVLDEHEILATLRAPNSFTPDATLMGQVGASLMTCGKALLVYDKADRSSGSDGRSTPSVYYVPMHWVTPIHKDGPFSAFRVQSDMGGEAKTFKRGEFVYFSLYDPADPFDAVSPMTAHGKTISAGDALATAHVAGLKNLINPSYAIRTGQLFDPESKQKHRPILGKDEREKLVTLLKQYSGGVLRNGEPIILDGLIEGIDPLGTRPKELDFLDSSKHNEERIMHGYGVSPIITGFAQNANRAGSTVAHGVFYDVVVNPLLGLVGRSFTLYLGPHYSTDKYEITVYYDAAVADDLEARRSRVSLFRGKLTDAEARRYMTTGQLDITEDDMLDAEASAESGADDETAIADDSSVGSGLD